MFYYRIVMLESTERLDIQYVGASSLPLLHEYVGEKVATCLYQSPLRVEVVPMSQTEYIEATKSA